MASRHLHLALAVVVLALLRPALTASQSGLRPAVRRPTPTVREALAYLDRGQVVTREQFRHWTGLHPADRKFSTRWRLADGALVTNYMELAPGRLVIACWMVEER